MKDKVILVTRKVPGAVEERLNSTYQPRLNDDDHLYGVDELIELSRGADAMVPCHTEKLTAEGRKEIARKAAAARWSSH